MYIIEKYISMAAKKAVKSPAVSNSSASYCQVFTIQYALEVSKKYLFLSFSFIFTYFLRSLEALFTRPLLKNFIWTLKKMVLQNMELYSASFSSVLSVLQRTILCNLLKSFNRSFFAGIYTFKFNVVGAFNVSHFVLVFLLLTLRR